MPANTYDLVIDRRPGLGLRRVAGPTHHVVPATPTPVRPHSVTGSGSSAIASSSAANPGADAISAPIRALAFR